MKYDVIIIGSGLGGLICGSLLSRSGKSVLVLERQTQPGGCMQSYRRHGLAFDTGFHYVGGLAEGQRLHHIFSFLGLMSLPWHRLDADGFDYVTIGDCTFAFAEGYDRFVDTLSEHFPHERESLRQYVSLLRRIEEEPIGSQGMYRLFGSSAYDYLTTTFHEPLLINVLSGTALKMELRRASLPLFTFAHNVSSFIGSSWRLKGSGNLIVQALTESIRRNGGDIVCHADVEELVEHDGRIVEARCSNGASYEGREYVSDIHPALTFSLIKDSRMLKHLFRKRINVMENTTGMFTLSLTLKPGALRYFNHNKYIYTDSDVWAFHEQVGHADHVGGVMVSCRVPEDGSDDARQVDLLTPMAWSACEPWADTAVGRRGSAYEALKAHMSDACMQLAEREIPGLRHMVSESHSSTPLTYYDYTRTPQGSAYGVRKDCRNLVITMLSPRTPIPNLLLTGQNLMLHGVEGVTMTALKTCEEMLGKDYIESVIKLTL